MGWRVLQSKWPFQLFFWLIGFPNFLSLLGKCEKCQILKQLTSNFWGKRINYIAYEIITKKKILLDIIINLIDTLDNYESCHHTSHTYTSYTGLEHKVNELRKISTCMPINNTTCSSPSSHPPLDRNGLTIIRDIGFLEIK